MVTKRSGWRNNTGGNGPSIDRSPSEADEKVDEYLLNIANATREKLYALVDAARSDEVIQKVASHDSLFDSLFAERNARKFYSVSPLLVELPAASPLLEWLTGEVWGDSYGVFLSSHASFDTLLDHFRRFIVVEIEGGEKVYFRFYDPRVLRTYLPTCTMAEIRDFFGPVSRFYVESESADEILVFHRK